MTDIGVRAVRQEMRRGADRIGAATPPGRDRAVDALRAAAVLGVVLGHWLVTALVSDGRTLRTASPLHHMPWLTPISWMFQTLAVFFLVGGHVATRSHASARARGVPYHQWLTGRLTRLFKPVTAVLALWTVAALALLLSGAEFGTVRTLVKLALSPLWFLLVFTGLTVATPLLTRLNPLWPLAVVLHVDLLRFGLGGPSWLGWVNVAAAWTVPYTLGAAWTRGELERRRAGWVLLGAGAAATAALVAWAGYPASMVGVPGEGMSNLDPPTLAVVTFGLAQCGQARGVGGGGTRQPLRDDRLPLAPDGPDGHDRHRPPRRPAARPAHPARRSRLGRGPAAVAAGVRAGPRGLLGRLSLLRTQWRPGPQVAGGAGAPAVRPGCGGEGATCLGWAA